MLSLIWDALRGVEHNYTEGPVRRAVILLAIPMAMEMVMESVFAVVDVFFVSRLGADAVATVGLTEAMLAIVYTVALALGIGATAVVVQVAVLFSGTARVRIAWRYLRVLPREMWTVCRLSGTGFLQVLIDTSSWIGLVRVVASFGSDALAGYTIAIRVVSFAILPAWGLSNAAATMVGQALGAGKPDRAEEATWAAGRLTAGVLGVTSVVFLALAPQIVAIFTVDTAIAPYAVGCLRSVSLGFVFFAYGLVLTQAFNGAGDPWTPTWLNFCCFWLWQIPLAYFLAIHLGWGPAGVYWAMTIAFSTFGLVSALVFRRGRWKTSKV